jgi:four helix bundle protein
MNYADWLKAVPSNIQDDALWNQEVYRLALFAADLAWHDCTRLYRDGRSSKLAAQLFEAVGSIGVNVSAGYSRGHQKDRARFYEYGLGPARESRTWYFVARHALGENVAGHRIGLQTQIIRLLLKMLPATRGYVLHEVDPQDAPWTTEEAKPLAEVGSRPLLESVPMPEL